MRKKGAVLLLLVYLGGYFVYHFLEMSHDFAHHFSLSFHQHSHEKAHNWQDHSPIKLFQAASHLPSTEGNKKAFLFFLFTLADFSAASTDYAYYIKINYPSTTDALPSMALVPPTPPPRPSL